MTAMWTEKERQAAQEIATDLTRQFRRCQTPQAQRAYEKELRQEVREAFGGDRVQAALSDPTHSELQALLELVVEHRLSQQLDSHA